MRRCAISIWKKCNIRHGMKLQGVRIKGNQSKKFISRKLSYTYPVYVIGKENTESFFHARLTRMRQLVIFGEISNNVDTTGTGSMRVAASRIPISYSCPASF
jgi:hypothetical protein